MSATAITPAQAELISSLSQDDIPIKLRCAICSRLAANAFRLPCCDQSICETCQSSLPSTCPVCEHSPVASEDCKPHKSLRTTIKVFLRTEEKKREALRAKEAKDTPPDTPVEPEPTPAAGPAPLSETNTVVNDVVLGEIKSEPYLSADVAEAPAASLEDIAQLQAVQQDIPQPSIEEIAPGQEPISDTDANTSGHGTAGDEEGQKGLTEMHGSGQAAEGASQTPAFGASFGFDSSAAAGFPGGFGGDMSQMQMMMAMQNGMVPNAYGNFPMMGMPGMSMDPMMMQNMQNMFMNGGFGAGMGMNGMMGGMGMGGFDNGVGGGFNNGWNGQQAWDVGPDKFNHPNAAGMGPGEYGANNSGYASHAAGYNQGNYGRGNQYNDYQNNNSGYRGRGRGRGAYGRGGYGYGSHDGHSQQYPQQFGAGNQSNGPISETGSIPTGPKADATPAGNVDEFGREVRQTSEAKETPTESTEMPKEATTPAPGNAVIVDGFEASVPEPSTSTDVQAQEAEDPSIPQPIQTLDEVQGPFAQTGYQNGYSNQYPARGGFQYGRGGNFGAMQPPVKPVDVPINAPTGPKAMREGLPNTSLHLRGRGFAITGSASSRANGSASAAPETSERDEKEKERSRSRTRGHSRSRDRKRSRSRERHRGHRHRHRSTSLSEDEKETERRRQRRNERRRRREEEGDDRDDTGSGDKIVADGKGLDDDRSHSASPSDSKRSSHRSRREKDKYRERERDSDREHRSSHKHRSSHRHRDDRSRSRDRDRDREHRHRHSRRGSEDVDAKTEKIESSVPPTPVEAEPPRRPSVISNGTNGIEIKGASIRRKNTVEEIVIPTGPRSSRDRQADTKQPSHRHREDENRSSRPRDSEKDRGKEKERPKPTPTAPAVKNPHEEEREARNIERLLKEAQRMAGLTGVAGGRKRSRDDGEEGRRGKKKGRREESDDARIARLEVERESARW